METKNEVQSERCEPESILNYSAHFFVMPLSFMPSNPDVALTIVPLSLFYP